MYRVAIICSFSISAKNICHVLQEEIEKKQLNIEVEAFHTEDCSKVIGNYDLVLLMPQIRYNFKNISKLLKPIETKVITNEQINQFVNDIQKESALSNQTIDKSVLLSTIDSLKRTFPVTLFITLFLYSLLLVQY